MQCAGNQFLGGNIISNKNKDCFIYYSNNFASAKKIINFFDKYHLLSSKHINYLKWRKSYLHLQNNEQDGLKKIIKLKSTMINYNRNIED